MDLERMMTVGAAAPLQAQEVFTNRLEQLSSFQAALDHARGVFGRREVVGDLLTGRSNVVAFHGMGGMGKTTLSEELQKRFQRGDFSAVGCVPVTAQMDFSKLELSSLEAVILHLRSTLGAATDTFRSFDLALHVYWERKHPGLPLRDFLDRSSTVGQWSRRLGVADQVDAVLDELLGAAGVVGTARRLTGVIASTVQRVLTERRLLRECPFFEPLINEPDPDQMLRFMPVLLAWDLATLQESRDVEVAVFIDTWEEVEQTRPERGGLEDVIARVVYLMPNVLFVITGRNRLTWGAEHRKATMLYAGPERWPGLADRAGSAPNQHLLGALSPKDCDQYLRARLVRDGKSAIPAAVRARIVAGSEGLPYYLDLSCDYFDELVARGDDPHVRLFGEPFPQLVVRLLRDLEGEERNLLRASALCSRFDAELLRQVVPGVTKTLLDRFLGRNFIHSAVSSGTAGALSWGLHTSLRESIRECDVGLNDSWAQEDWLEAASRAVPRFESLLQWRPTPGNYDTTELVLGFRGAIELALDTGGVAEGLAQAAWALRGLGLDSVLELAPLTLPSQQSATVRFVESCRLIAHRRVRSTDATYGALRMLADHHSDSSLGDPALLEAACTAMVLGDFAAAQRDLNSLVQGEGPLAPTARLDLAGLSWRRGEYASALAVISNRPEDELSQLPYVDLQGLIYLYNGDLSQASREFLAELQRATDSQAGLWQARAARHLALARLDSPADCLQSAQQALRLNERQADGIGVGQCYLALALGQPRERIEDALDLVRKGEAMLATLGAVGNRGLVLGVEFILTWTSGGVHGAGSALSRLQEVSSGNADARRWLEICTLATGAEQAPLAGDRVEWLGGPGAAAARWRHSLERRRRSLALAYPA